MTDIAAFTSEHVCRLTGLTARQLGYWDQTGFFSPTILDDTRSRAFSKIYSFRDVVGLRTIAILRNDRAIPLQELRRVGDWLRQYSDTPWSSLRFALNGRRVVFFSPVTGKPTEAHSGLQTVIEVALQPIANEMRKAASLLTKRGKGEIGKISRKRYVVHNAWVLAGTRIPTEGIWNFHEAGYDASAIIAEYPRLTKQDIRAAIRFEADRRKAA